MFNAKNLGVAVASCRWVWGFGRSSGSAPANRGALISLTRQHDAAHNRLTCRLFEMEFPTRAVN